ncbi:MAG: hypothetical protein F4X02_13140 [Chloroflexi bacterium]|nr:hypothetical protein [Chloroflexota bacterium]
MSTRKSVLIRAAVLVLLTLTALELALQLAFPRLPAAIIEQMPQYRARMGFRLDAAHGLQEYPAGETVNYEITKSSGDLYKLTCLSPDSAPPFDSYRVSFQRDWRGFRNPEPWPDKLALAIIGDSFTAAEAIVSPFWHGLSDSMLVLGLPGSGTLQQQRLLEAFALPRDPDVVVLAFFAGNDLQDSLAFHQKLAANGGDSSAGEARKSPLDYSVLFNIAYSLRRSVLRQDLPCHHPQHALTEPPTPVAFYDRFLSVFALDIETLRESEMFRVTRDSIAEMAAMLAAKGSRLMLMYIPQKAELYWELLSDESKAAILAGGQVFDAAVESRVVSANLAAQRRLIAELAGELDIAFLDLTPALSGAISVGEQPYFYADTHWNQAGHNIARIALLDFLNQSNLE